MKLAGVLFFITLAIYGWTLAPTVAPQGDSGELVTVAYTLGIAHPPGYPLYTLLGHVFTLLPFGSVAWRVNLLSAVLHGLSVALLYLIVKKLTNNVLAAVAAAMAASVSSAFWLYSLVAEVFALNDFLALSAIFITMGISAKSSARQLAVRLGLIGLVLGLGLANNTTIVLIIPAIGYWVLVIVGRKLWGLKVRDKFRLAASLVLGGILGLAPYVYVLIRSRTAVFPVAWSYPQNLWELWRMFTRADYGTFSPTLGVDPALTTLLEKWRQVVEYLGFLRDDFLLVGVILAVLGVLVGLVKRRKEAIFAVIGFLVCAVFFLSYANFPYGESSGTGIAIIERFYLLPNLFAAIAIGLGADLLSRWGSRRFAFRYLGWPVVIIYLVFLGLSNYQMVNQRGNYKALQYAKDTLSGLPPHALIMPLGDIPTFTIVYARYVENFRPDVEVVTINSGGPENRHRYLKSVRPDLDLAYPQSASLAGIIKANFDKAPIYVSVSPSFVAPAGFVASPSGFLLKVVKRTDVVSFDAWRAENERTLAGYQLTKDPALSNVATSGDFAIQSSYVYMYLNLGSYCYASRHYDCALEYFSLAHDVDKMRVEGLVGMAQAQENLGMCQQAEESYLGILKLNPKLEQVYANLYKLATDCFHDPKKAQYYAPLKDRFEQKVQGNLKDL